MEGFQDRVRGGATRGPTLVNGAGSMAWGYAMSGTTQWFKVIGKFIQAKSGEV